MLIENVMGDRLTEAEMLVQVCIPYNETATESSLITASESSLASTEGFRDVTSESIINGKLHPMNHSMFIYFATGYMFFMTLLFGLFFNTKLKRTMADEGDLDLKDVLNSDELNENKESDKNEQNIEADILPENKRASKVVSIELSDIKSNVKAERG